MALRGNLKDFTLADVFQLVALSRKTGVLRMHRRDASRGAVWFRDGDVFFAESNWRRERLGDRLVAARRITPDALKWAVQLRAAEPQGRRLGTILVEEGHISREVLEAFVREQILDTVFDLMRWEEGEFDFELTFERPEEDIGLAVSIENIAMESGRRLEEWERIKRKVPSMDIVFKMSTAPGEGPFEISLKPIEWNLLLLIDGTRSVAQVARAAQMTDFDVAKVVYGLFSAGLLEVVSDDEATRLRGEKDAAGSAWVTPTPATPEEYAAGPAVNRSARHGMRRGRCRSARARQTAVLGSQNSKCATSASATSQAPRPLQEPSGSLRGTRSNTRLGLAPQPPLVEQVQPAGAPTYVEPATTPPAYVSAEEGPWTEDVAIVEQSTVIAGDVFYVTEPAVEPESAPVPAESMESTEESVWAAQAAGGPADAAVDADLATLGLAGGEALPGVEGRYDDETRLTAQMSPGSSADVRLDLEESSAISEEITELTGVSRSQGSVPSSAGRAAASGPAAPHVPVDKMTLLGIIESIKKL